MPTEAETELVEPGAAEAEAAEAGVEGIIDAEVVTDNLYRRGFSLKQLLLFYDAYGKHLQANMGTLARKLGHSPTTSDVVKHLVIPHTKEQKCSFMEGNFMKQLGGPQVPGKLVSHAWGSEFQVLMVNIVSDATGWKPGMIAAYLRAAPRPDGSWPGGKSLLHTHVANKCPEAYDRTYWLCIWAVNQHTAICGTEWNPCDCGSPKYLSPDPRCEMDKFEGVVRRVGEILVSLDMDFTNFTRIWCLAEVGSAMINGYTLTICASKGIGRPQQSGNLVQFKDTPEALQKKLADGEAFVLPIQECETRYEADKQHILASIEAGVGVEEFNRHIAKWVDPIAASLLLHRAQYDADGNHNTPEAARTTLIMLCERFPHLVNEPVWKELEFAAADTPKVTMYEFVQTSWRGELKEQMLSLLAEQGAAVPPPSPDDAGAGAGAR